MRNTNPASKPGLLFCLHHNLPPQYTNWAMLISNCQQALAQFSLPGQSVASFLLQPSTLISSPIYLCWVYFVYLPNLFVLILSCNQVKPCIPPHTLFVPQSFPGHHQRLMASLWPQPPQSYVWTSHQLTGERDRHWQTFHTPPPPPSQSWPASHTAHSGYSSSSPSSGGGGGGGPPMGGICAG